MTSQEDYSADEGKNYFPYVIVEVVLYPVVLPPTIEIRERRSSQLGSFKQSKVTFNVPKLPANRL